MGVNIKDNFLQMIKMKKFTLWKKITPKKKINMENIHIFCKKRQFQNDEMKVNGNRGSLNVHVFNSSYGESNPI
jgi:hypothetical protein